MIRAYYRPHSLEEALKLLSRSTPPTLPLGGGTVLSHHRGEGIEVVDLQALGLDMINERGRTLEAGAMVTLGKLMEHSAIPRAIQTALRLDAPLNLRNASSLAGALVTADGRSSLCTCLIALDALIGTKTPGAGKIPLGEFLVQRGRHKPPFLITSVEWPLLVNLEFDYVARTPLDKPIVAIAIARWPSGRTRAAVAGWGSMPLLAMDGSDSSGVEAAVRNSLHDASDPWASAAYRMEAGAVLARRCLACLTEGKS